MDLAVETPGIENDEITNSRRETEDGPENRTQKKSVADTLRERSEVDPVSGELVLGPSSATGWPGDLDGSVDLLSPHCFVYEEDCLVSRTAVTLI